MKLLALVLAACVVPAFASSCPTNQPKERRALEQAEQRWAKALEHHDAETLACLLATEFQDTDPDGQVHDRAATLAAVPNRKPGENRLSELQATVQGDVGYIRGMAKAVDPAGKFRATVRFTDIYVYRDGRWQCVAGHESIVSEKAP
jgi:ketosteroid isomerase-like protein